MLDNKAELICDIKGLNCEILQNEPMKKHTSFKIGGPADLFIKVKDTSSLKQILSSLRSYKIPFVVVGLGANLLVKDSGIRKVVLKLNGEFAKLEKSPTCEEEVECGAGVTLAKLCTFAQKKGLFGAQCLYGIPGTIGGAICMNAGAYGAEIKDIVKKVRYIDENLKECEVSQTEAEFAYRNSLFKKIDCVVTHATFLFKKGNAKEIKEKMNECLAKRKTTQPLEYPSAGSVFKRPPGHFVGPTLTELGLKGKQIGGAMVSTKHAGFIVNTGGAKEEDVTDLINLIKQQVKKEKGIDLECEIQMLGFE